MEYPTAYKLCKALRDKDPPVYVSDGIAKQWLLRFHGELQYVDNAGHLETLYGERIRANAPQEHLAADALSSWLRREHRVSVLARVCQKWLSTDWSSSGRLLTPLAVEGAVGDRLRLDEYRHQFADEASAQRLAEVLAESQPPVRVSGLVLRQWHCKFHPDSGPLSYATADALEESWRAHLVC